jgi:rhamnosyltransferase
VECARAMGAEVAVVPRRSFNHGATREFARKRLGTPIVVFMTQDAQPVDESFLERLVSPLQKGEAAVSYARQIPREGAGTIEAFPREFNYPAVSNMRSIIDTRTLGVYTFFCSDSCAAYVSSALDEIGGFRHVLTAEDTFAVARLLGHGYRIAYVADAVVRHSHHYSLIQDFRRHFDTGYVRRCHRDLLCGLSDERRGARYARAFLMELWLKNRWAIGEGAAGLMAKYIGYRIGSHADALPLWLRQRLSSQPSYWTSLRPASGATPPPSKIGDLA